MLADKKFNSTQIFLEDIAFLKSFSYQDLLIKMHAQCRINFDKNNSWLISKDIRDTCSLSAIEQIIHEHAVDLSHLTEKQLAQWKEYCTWELLGIGPLEAIWNLSDWYELRIKNLGLEIRMSESEHTVTPSLFISGEIALQNIIDSICCEKGVRIDEQWPMQETLWRGRLFQVACFPVSTKGSYFVRIINIEKLLVDCPETKIRKE